MKSVAVVTGGGHGIGRALCRRLAADDVNVVVVDIEGDAAEIVAREIGGTAKQVDVADEAAIERLVEEIEAEIGPIDLFISNAGVAFGGNRPQQLASPTSQGGKQTPRTRSKADC